MSHIGHRSGDGFVLCAVRAELMCVKL